MDRITSTDVAWPLHGAEASRRIEQAALAGVAPHLLMRRAGEAVARLALALAPHAQSVWVAAGPGNNGGDALEAAALLHRLGRRVTVTLLGDAARLPADAADALARAQQAGVAIDATLPATIDADLVLDGLLGLGARRPPDGAIAQAIDLTNAGSSPVLAIDLPSGLNCDTGQPIGTQAVRAAHTLALLTLKPGLFTALGRDHAGDVWLDGLGVGVDAAPDAWLGGGAALRRLLAPRSHAQHKGSFGDTLVIGGAPGMAGAALLAARAALVLGSGRVYAGLLDDDAPTFDAAHAELMLRPLDWALRPETLAASTVVCGCGGGDAVRGALPAVLHHAARLVLDADALNAIAADAALQPLLRSRSARGQSTLLTPHPLEAARLRGDSAAAVQADRLQVATELAQRFRCCVLLKGSGSVIAAPDTLPMVNPTGNALLASPGTGDVLAGAIGALWSQHVDASAHEVAAAAAWLHGRAADQTMAAGGAVVLTASRLIDAMAKEAA
jgi:hydroxyethylthiazole kinase-like uncharacterized protein yjeF